MVESKVLSNHHTHWLTVLFKTLSVTFNQLFLNQLFNNQFRLKFSNNQDHKTNLTLKTFQSKRPIPTMNQELTTFKSHMKDNTPNKFPNKELNMFQLQNQLPNIKLLPTLVMSQFKKLTLTINKSNTLPNMYQT